MAITTRHLYCHKYGSRRASVAQSERAGAGGAGGGEIVPAALAPSP